MAYLNRVELIGHLGKDPEIRVFPDGTPVASISVATTEYYKDKETGERKDITQWHNITVTGKKADFCREYLKKGSFVFISGKLNYRSYEKDGQKRLITEIILNDFNGEVQILDKKEADPSNGLV
ncbi:single-stranded DNA-binding protein [Pasteurella multocida]|uniref:single-stranded DNA-binding protein n=1 Tax=Pasteurella multocida TaxID=747 RepID=UPI0009F20F0F|nr:single-stranded DNA-binding protein [Pasteurella multocida]MEB3502327.1 single-stranded DNA-binding protein [Pasteurella multocida]PNM06755.1 single-stranded DNA-binding protein [Pasteurella multocida]